MPDLYLRNVPDDVVERLERPAATDPSSVSASAIRELDEASRRSDSARFLGSQPDTGVSVDAILDGLDDGRSNR